MRGLQPLDRRPHAQLNRYAHVDASHHNCAISCEGTVEDQKCLCRSTLFSWMWDVCSRQDFAKQIALLSIPKLAVNGETTVSAVLETFPSDPEIIVSVINSSGYNVGFWCEEFRKQYECTAAGRRLSTIETAKIRIMLRHSPTCPITSPIRLLNLAVLKMPAPEL